MTFCGLKICYVYIKNTNIHVKSFNLKQWFLLQIQERRHHTLARKQNFKDKDMNLL